MMFSVIENVLSKKFLSLTLNTFSVQVRSKKNFKQQTPRKRYPEWFPNSRRIIHEDYITPDNREFLKEYVAEHNKKLLADNQLRLSMQSPLSGEPEAHAEWTKKSRRTGIIVRKIGNYPMWDKDGNTIQTTLLQVADNHVIKYTPPEQYITMRKRAITPKNKLGCLLVGADTIDPSLVTKEYYGLFAKSGLPAKKQLFRFFITEDAKLSPGTPLQATHFRVGDFVDVLGLTIDRGFQGVMKRWGFKGMPATHGVTKTHRRPGNIGGGGEKGRVWPGTKLPGHMGNSWRVLKGVEILRINPANNVLWVRGVAIAGKTGAYCYMFDSILPTKRHHTPPPFPTSYGEEDLPEDIYHKDIHIFDAPTIEFNE